MLAACLLGGCSTVWNLSEKQELSSHKPAPGVTEPAETLAALLSDGERYKSLPAGQRQRELAKVKDRYLQHRSAYNLLRLALLTALGPGYRPDGTQVRAGLRDYVQQKKAPQQQWTPLAGLLLHVLDERARLLEEKRALQRELDRHEADMRELNEQLDRHKADEQRLSQKLNELKAIEQKLNERSKPEVIKIPP